MAENDDIVLQAIEDLIHLDIISVKLDRLSAIRGPGGVEPNITLSVLERRSDLLLKLSAKLLVRLVCMCLCRCLFVQTENRIDQDW